MYDFTRDLHALYDPDSTSLSVSLSGQRIYLTMRLIDPLGIITGEIISNALIRARTREQYFRLDISWEVDEQGLLSLSYRDTGGGFLEDAPINLEESLGMIIIRALVEQMGAKVSVANGVMGAVITIELNSLSLV
jgi:two-component sensor histidine kinase